MRVLNFRTTLEHLSTETLLKQRELVNRQSRVVVPFEEFRGYRLNLKRFGHIAGNVDPRTTKKARGSK